MATNGATPVAAVQLPIFDISDPTPEVGRSMIAAAAKYGFLFLDTKGTDFAEAIVDRVFETVRRRMASSPYLLIPLLQSKDFFSSPEAEKAECRIGHDVSGPFASNIALFTLTFSTSQNMGWTGMHGEILDPAIQKVSGYWMSAVMLY
jgi:hypothetical protein